MFGTQNNLSPNVKALAGGTNSITGIMKAALYIPASYYKPNMQLLPIPKWDLPPTQNCQLPDGCVK